MKNFKIYMKRCFDLATFYRGSVRTNPLVGALIVDHDRIVAEGAHEQFGKAHAEVNAIAQLTDSSILRKSSLFVSLEPCFHFGKTPPCVQLILRSEITDVWLSCQDPFLKVSGKSIALLRENKVNVHEHIEQEAGRELIRPFVTGITSKRPYIILKYAQSSDAKIGFSDRQVWLSNTFSKMLVHKWRSEADAVMVGTNTALTDNPRLDNRLYFGKKDILRIVIDKTLKIPKTHHLMDGTIPTLVVTAMKKDDSDNIAYFQSNFEGDYLKKFTEYLYQREIGVLLIEGGSVLLQSFIDANLWDEARIFTVNQQLGEHAVPAPVLKNAILIKKREIQDDLLCQYYNESLI